MFKTIDRCDVIEVGDTLLNPSGYEVTVGNVAQDNNGIDDIITIEYLDSESHHRQSYLIENGYKIKVN